MSKDKAGSEETNTEIVGTTDTEDIHSFEWNHWDSVLGKCPMDIAEVYFLKNFGSFRTLEPVQVTTL